MTTAILLFMGLTLTMLTGLGLAAAAIREDKLRFRDETPSIDKELQLNAKIRELQGVNRVGDELTERYKTVEHVGRVREQTERVLIAGLIKQSRTAILDNKEPKQ